MTFVPILVATVSPAKWWLSGSLFILGACIGSFLNVVVYRLPAGRSLISPPSNCPQCKTPIKAADNIPILSWLLLRGRCRNCAFGIPLRYPLIELLTAAFFARLGWVAVQHTAAVDWMDSLIRNLIESGWLLLVALIGASCLIVVACWCRDGVPVSVGFGALVAGTMLGLVMLSPAFGQRLISVGYGALAGLIVGGTCQLPTRLHSSDVPARAWPNSTVMGVLTGLLVGQSELILILVSATAVAFGYGLFIQPTNSQTPQHTLAPWAVCTVVLCGVLADPFQVSPEVSPRYAWPALGVIGALSLLTRLVVPRQS